MKIVRYKSTTPMGYRELYPFKEDEVFLLLGEIENMPGHVAVVNQNGKVFWGYHEEHFVDDKITEF